MSNYGFPRTHQLEALAAADKRRRRKLMIFALWAAPVVFVLCVLFVGAIDALIYAFSAWVGITIFALYTSRSENDYRRAGGADERGTFCLTCGHRGVWRSTEYKTTDSTAKCSRCRTFLWKE